MPKVESQYTSFNGGVVSKFIEARGDIAKYPSSVRDARNVFFLPEGGFKGRAGLKFFAETHNGQVAYPYKFEPSTGNAYILVFGNQYLRFIKNGAWIMDGGSPYQIVTPYLIADIPQMLATGARESVDVLFLDAAGYEPRRLSRFSDTNWTLTTEKLNPPPTSEQDEPINAILGLSVALGISTFIGAQVLAAGTPFLAADADKEFIYSSGKGSITAATTSQLTVDVVTPFPLVAGTHFNYKTSTASGAATTINFTAAHGLAVGDFIERADSTVGVGLPTGEIRRVTGVTDADTVTINAAFTADPNTGNGWYHVLPLAVNLASLRGSPQTTLDFTAKEPIGKVMNGTAGAAAFRSTDVGKIVKLYGGAVEITKFNTSTSITVKILSALVDADTNPAAAPAGTWRLESPIWSATRGYPTTNEFHQGRLWHAGSSNDPTTIVGSRTNNYSNYATGALATDALQYTHASGNFDRTHWLMSASNLFFGNGQSEVTMRGSGVGVPLGGNEAPEVIEQSFRGSSAIRPEKLSKSFVFVGRNGSRIFKMGADEESAELGKYKSIPANILARGIENPGIVIHPIAVMRDPFHIGFFIRSDGKMLAYTNDDDEDVHAFCLWDTAGTIKGVAVITHPDDDSQTNQIWMCVERNINGVTKYYLEVVEDHGHDPLLCSWEEFSFDSATKITKSDSAAQATLTGLTHLAGKEVRALMYRTDQADPQNPRDLGTFTVSGAGVLTLTEEVDYPCIFEVGLDFDCYVQTLRPGIAKSITDGHKRKWVMLYLRLCESIPPTVNGERLPYEYAMDASEQILADQGPKLVTSDVKVRSDEWQYDLNGYLMIDKERPGPIQVLAAFGEVEFGAGMA